VVAALAAGWSTLPAAARRLIPAGVLVLLVWAVGPAARGGGAAPDQPVLVALDVGQGDAMLVGDPTAGWILIDGGPDPDVLADALRRRRVDRLAAVVATHPHADHTAGLAHPLTAMPVGALLVGPTGRQDGALVAAAGDVPVLDVAAGDAWAHGDLRLQVLSPPATGLGTDPNDNSLVIRVDVTGGRSVLLTGDAEVVPQLLLTDDPLIDVDVLKVPHHGGATNHPGFLDATSPQIAVISVGPDNPFGHPHPDVLADLDGVDVRRTDLHGDIALDLSPTQ
jgi:competence protein ComEC